MLSSISIISINLQLGPNTVKRGKSQRWRRVGEENYKSWRSTVETPKREKNGGVRS